MFLLKSDFISPPTGPSERIELANGDYIFSKGCGQSNFGEALYVPDLSTGLISTPQDDLLGKFTVYGKGQVSVYDTEPIPTSEAIRGGILMKNSQYVAIESNKNLLSRKVSVFNTGQHRNSEPTKEVDRSFHTDTTCSAINLGDKQNNNVNQNFHTNSISSAINFGNKQTNNVDQNFHTDTTCPAIKFGDNRYNYDNTTHLSNIFSANSERLINNNFLYPLSLNAHISTNHYDFLHQITAHKSIHRINQMILQNTLIGLPKQPIKIDIPPCDPCLRVKTKKRKPPSTRHRRPQGILKEPKTYQPFEVVAIDTIDCCPKDSDARSIQGNRYCTFFLDRCTDFGSVYFHKKKNQFLNKCLTPYVNDLVTPNNGKIKFLQSDDDPNYKTPNVRDYLAKFGSRRRISAPYHLIQNRAVERVIDTVMNSATICMLTAHTPRFMFESAIQYAMDARNEGLTNQHPSKSPSERLNNIKPTLKGKYPFFHPAYFVLEDHSKFKEKAQLCHILRLMPEYKDAYEIYAPSNKTRLLVRFDVHPASHPLYKHIENQSSDNIENIPILDYLDPKTPNHTDFDNPATEADLNQSSNSPMDLGGDDNDNEKGNPSSSNPRGLRRRLTKDRRKTKEIQDREKLSEDRRERIRKFRVNLNNDLVEKDRDRWNSAQDAEEELGNKRRQRLHKKRSYLIDTMPGRPQPKTHKRSRKESKSHHSQAMITSGLPHTPSTVEEALTGPNATEWKKAIEDEKIAINTHATYEPAPGHKGRCVKSKIAFRVTREPDGSLKFKARLVAKGFTERKGYDYFHTFAPTVMSKSTHMVLHLAAKEDWIIRNLDVGGAYLEADVDTELYMEIPAEFNDGTGTRVRLRKSIYGLKQSGELWNKRIHGIFISMGFSRSIDDPCVYTKTTNDERIILCLYVDDILVIGSNLQQTLEFETTLSTKVMKLKIIGNTTRFVGINIKRNREERKIYLSQEQFVSDIVINEGLEDKPTKPSPSSVSRDLYTAPLGGNEPIRSLVGKLRYAVDHTRPDALFPTSQISSAASSPGEQHLYAAQHLVRYLNGTSNLCLTLGGTDPIVLECFADSSYVESGESKSQLAYCMRLGKSSGMFLSRSIKDTHVSLSSAESEIYAVKEAIQDIVWSRNMLEFLGVAVTSPTPIYEDNQAVLFLTETVKVHPRTKHINKILNFIREFITEEVICLIKVHTSINVADIMTKNLDVKQFLFLRPLLLGT